LDSVNSVLLGLSFFGDKERAAIDRTQAFEDIGKRERIQLNLGADIFLALASTIEQEHHPSCYFDKRYAPLWQWWLSLMASKRP
jgi:hypothetical protein